MRGPRCHDGPRTLYFFRTPHNGVNHSPDYSHQPLTQTFTNQQTMKYWVIFNNKQEGPYTLEQLQQYPLTMQTPVWHQGLPQWVTADRVPELRFMIQQMEQARMQYGSQPYVQQTPPMPQQTCYQQQPPYAQQQQQYFQQQPYQQPYDNSWGPRPGYRRQQQQPDVKTSATGVAEERPSNYLGWAIAVTLLCCMPLGVVAIIYAAGVNNKYDRGDVTGARKSSERAQLWIILSIVLGLIWIPISALLQMITQL